MSRIFQRYNLFAELLYVTIGVSVFCLVSIMKKFSVGSEALFSLVHMQP